MKNNKRPSTLKCSDPTWRPEEFRSSLFGSEAGIRIRPVKLLDFAAHGAALQASTNPFAKLTLAHLKARQTHSDPAGPQTWKMRLVRGLYESGFNAQDVRELFRLIDWLMELPPALEDVFWQEVDQLQKEKTMPFVTTPERVGICKGMRMSIEAALKVRFGEEGLDLMPEIREIHEEEKLKAIIKAIITASSREDVRKVWVPGDQ